MKRTAIIVIALLVTTSLFAGDVVKRGAPLTIEKTTPLADVIAKPADFSKAPVLVEGTIEAVCQEKGCWMEIAPETGKPAMRVTFKDYGFFVPKDAKGYKVRAEGVTKVVTQTAEHAKHMVAEGAKLKLNADGTATEATFVATGVELTK